MFLFSKKKPTEKKPDRAELAKQALMATANEVSELSKDITAILRDRIEDFSRQFETLAKIIPDLLIMIKENGEIVFCNDLCRSLLTVEQGDNLYNILKYGSYQISSIKDLRNAEETFPESTLLSDTTYLTNQAETLIFKPRISSFDNSASEKQYVIILENVTSRVIDEQRFVTLHNYNKTVLTSIPDILVTITSMGIIKTVHNPLNDILFTPQNIGEHFSVCNCTNVIDFVSSNMITNDFYSLDFECDLYEQNYHLNLRVVACGKDEYLIVIRDVTNVVKMRQDLEMSTAHFLAFGKASSEAMFIHIEDDIVRWNDNFKNMVGYDDDGIKSLRPIDLIHPIERDRYNEIVEQDDEIRAYKMLLIDNKGSTIETTIQDNEIEWSNETARIKVMRDVGELNNIDEVLKLSRERYKSIVNNTIDIVYCFNSNMEIVFRNSTFNEYFGVAEGGFPDVLKHIDVRDKERAKQDIAKLSSSNQIMREVYRINREGITRWLDTIIRVLLDQHTNILEYHVIARDVTEYISRNNNR